MTLVIRFEAGLRPILKHQEHDQSSHGSWAKGSSESDYQMSHRPSLGSGTEGDMDGASLDNVSNGIYPDDVYSPRGVQIYGTGYKELDKQAHAFIMEYRGKPEKSITIYRAIPKDASTSKISGGEWVTPIKQYAVQHGQSNLNDDYQILTREVKAKEIFTSGDSWLEWGYAPSTVQKHQDHDQKTHGNWATGETVSDINEWNKAELSKYPSLEEKQKYLDKKMLSQVEDGFEGDSFKGAVKTYQGLHGYGINEALRDPLISEEQYQDDINGLDNAINSAPSLSEPLTVFRGIKGNGLDFFESLKVGDIYQDKGFVSTTLDTQVATDFSTNSMYQGIVLRYKLPAGTKGFFPAGVTGLEASYESEFVLPRNSKFKVLNNQGKVWDVEVIND